MKEGFLVAGAFYAAALALMVLLGSCAKRAEGFPISAQCSEGMTVGSVWFRECQLFGRTCIVGGGALWCSER